jgi:TonB family protein
MTDTRHCVKCQRAIDQWATLCPFCNWNQAEPPPPPESVQIPAQVAAYKPPEELSVRKVVLMSVGIILMLVCAFGIGMVINSDGAPEKAPEALEEQAAEHNQENLKPKRADTPLVPAGEGGIDQTPITSAPIVPAPGAAAPDDYQRSDATAVSADEYAQMAKRANAEKKRMAVLVDPRSLTGPAYAQGARLPVQPSPRTAAPMPGSIDTGIAATPQRVAPARRSVRTRPVPQYQPLPSIRGTGKARFTLVVGSDGRVRDVNVDRMLNNGNTAALLGAIQNWRFKPATENGEPISAPYSVEISFNRE